MFQKLKVFHPVQIQSLFLIKHNNSNTDVSVLYILRFVNFKLRTKVFYL